MSSPTSSLIFGQRNCIQTYGWYNLYFLSVEPTKLLERSVLARLSGEVHELSGDRLVARQVRLVAGYIDSAFLIRSFAKCG